MDSTTSKRPSATQSPIKSGTKKKVLSAASRESKRKYDKSRSGTRISIGYVLEEWRLLQLDLGLKKDADMAHFLVTSYRKKQAPETAIQGGNVKATSTPSMRTAAKMSHRLSPVEPVSEGEDFLMAGVEALADDQGLDPFEESFKSMDLATDAVKIDEDQANNLLNSVAAGGLQRAVDALPIVGLDESVIDILQRDDETDEEADNPEQYEEADNDVPSFPSLEKVSIEEDLVNQPACIAFTSSMARLVNFLQLPIQKCFYRDKMIGTECDATPPFHVKLNRRGSATIIEWFCINGHMLWKWNSQPVLKYAMQGGDFMVATNILLSGNNF
ncbi:uncharacterized protein [Nothobranchius furzeri]|uniref:uncharacterized protein isoform X1 n=1 Tax=Nothobranchius furzeri TaxID=105023 RepID=UPI003904D0D1